MNVAPGWYDDGSGTLRWWDGYAWTEMTQQPVYAHAPAAPQQQVAPEAPTSAGWYSDGTGLERWWNGISWSDATRVPPGRGAATRVDRRLSEIVDYSATDSAARAPLTPPPSESPSGDQRFQGGSDFDAPQQPYGQQSQQYAQYNPLVPPPTSVGVVAEEPQKKRLSFLTVLAALVVIGAIGAGVAYALISTTTEATNSGPQDAITAYDKAWNDDDCDAYFAVTTEKFREELHPDCELFTEAVAQDAGVVIDFVDTTVSGNEATVDTQEVTGSSIYKYRYTLVNQDDAWLLDEVVLINSQED